MSTDRVDSSSSGSQGDLQTYHPEKSERSNPSDNRGNQTDAHPSKPTGDDHPGGPNSRDGAGLSRHTHEEQSTRADKLPAATQPTGQAAAGSQPGDKPQPSDNTAKADSITKGVTGQDSPLRPELAKATADIKTADQGRAPKAVDKITESHKDRLGGELTKTTIRYDDRVETYTKHTDANGRLIQYEDKVEWKDAGGNTKTDTYSLTTDPNGTKSTSERHTTEYKDGSTEEIYKSTNVDSKGDSSYERSSWTVQDKEHNTKATEGWRDGRDGSSGLATTETDKNGDGKRHETETAMGQLTKDSTFPIKAYHF